MAFIFGGDTGETADSAAAKRKLAEALMAQGSQTGPVASPWEGANRAAQAITGALLARSADRATSDADAQVMAALSGQPYEPPKSSGGMLGRIFGGGPEKTPGTTNSSVAPATSDYVDPKVAALPQGASSATGGQDATWLSYANQNATRSQPLSQDLSKAMSFLPELGVKMEVFSGGQPGAGEGGGRVGSTRHDHGGAGDVFFYKDGRRLDWNNAEDVPVYQEIVRRAKAAGVTGFGAGDGYMQPGSMHLGFGAPAVWGAGGKGANAPQWLSDAYNGPAPAAPAPAQASGPQVAQNGGGVQAVTQALAGRQGGMADPEIARLVQLSRNVSPGMRSVVNAIIQQKMQQAAQAADPLRQLQIRKAEMDISGGSQLDQEVKRAGLRKTEAELGQMGKTGDIKDYEYAKSQGYTGSFSDYQTAIKKAGASSVNIDQRAEGQFEKDVGSAQAKIFTGMAEDAVSAKAQRGQISQLRQQLARTPGGLLGGLQGLASQWGVKLGPNASAIEAAQATISQLVPAQRQGMPGAASDRDVEMFKSSLPKLSNTPEGNQVILDTMDALAAYREEQGKIATQVVTGQMTRADGMKALQALPDPLARFKEATAPKPSETAIPEIGTKADGYTFLGGNPGDPNNWRKD